MDDYTMYRNEIRRRFWVNPSPSATGGDSNAVNTIGVLGIKNNMPGMDKVIQADNSVTWVPNGVHFDITGTARAKFDVAGDEKGSLKGENFCHVDGMECFETAKIGGLGMRNCYKETVATNLKRAGMSGIALGDSECIGIMSGLTGVKCPSGKYVTGLDATGKPICN